MSGKMMTSSLNDYRRVKLDWNEFIIISQRQQERPQNTTVQSDKP